MDSINEDTVHCLFYSICPIEDLSEWESLREEMNKIIEILSQDYIWHRDKFKIQVVENNLLDVPIHLSSITCFGDNIEDEWFILYLCLEITKKYPNIVVQIRDNDGDFILIEAADYLPSWANPDTTLNRVFVYNNHIHIISPDLATDKRLNIANALKVIIQCPEKTQAPANIEKVILERIGNYPQKINENIHKAICNIPADLATLLQMEPSLIAAIVTTYYSHDPLDVKFCNNIDIGECIQAQVKFTKYLYSLIFHSKLIKNIHSRPTNNNKASVIGLKLSFGFHMILRSGNDIFTSKAFAMFMSSLKEKGYFKKNMEGSQEYNKLLENAKNYFTNNECSYNSSLCNKISQLMSSKDFKELKESLISNSQTNLTEDSDDWLNVHPEQLNELLNKRYNKQVNFKNNDVITAQTITNKLSNFLQNSSDFEGIETNTFEQIDSTEIIFEADKFTECIENLLNGLDIEEDTESDISFEDKESNDEEFEEEVRSNLLTESDLRDSKSILQNMMQSMKEEKASQGPSSILLNNVGINKRDLLDSDDDE